jgi:hypothetical protein
MSEESQASNLRGSSSEAQCLVSFRTADQFVATVQSLNNIQPGKSQQPRLSDLIRIGQAFRDASSSLFSQNCHL